MMDADRFWYGIIALWALVVLGVLFTACDFPMGIVEGESETTPGCALESFQDPWGTEGMARRTRGFLANDTHLGLDMGLPEGRPIRPIGCGVVRFARAARGYGTLVVVVEHRLTAGLSFLNGNGERVFVDRFLSIYGHLRLTPDREGQGTLLDLRPGAIVTPRTVIGYIQHRSLNGDGEEHLHLGIRLQTSEAAQRADSSAWFRGYDAMMAQKGWFADPEDVLLRLRQAFERGAGGMDAGTPIQDAAAPQDRAAPPDRPTDIVSSVDRPSISEGRDVTSADHGSPVPMADAVSDASVMSAPDGALMPPDHAPASMEPLIRYEFRLRSELYATPPYRLRDLWWRPITCRNTGSIEPVVTSDGWVRCEAQRLGLFDGSMFLPDLPEWGDMGQIGTVANVPARCTPVVGASWRLTELPGGRVLYDGPASGLRCQAVGTQDRWRFPE